MIYLTAIVWTPGGSSTHLHTNNTQNNTNKQYIEQHIIDTKQYIEQHNSLIRRVRTVPRLCELYPDVCLITKEKARKNLRQGSQRIQLFGKNSRTMDELNTRGAEMLREDGRPLS
jgi:hypothetical protein